MVLPLVGVKQSQMEFAEGSITIFIEGPLKTRFQSSQTSAVGTRVQKWTEPAFQCVTIYKKRFLKKWMVNGTGKIMPWFAY